MTSGPPLNPLRGARITGMAAVLLALGLLAGSLNFQLLDGPRFARHVDEVRQDPAVSAEAGAVITAQILTADPDLVVARPLVQAAVVAVVGSDAFSPVVRFAAQEAYRTLTEDRSGPVSLRLTDLGAVVAGALPELAPGVAAKLPPNFAVTLAEVDQTSLVARVVHLAHLLALLAWLLPALGLLLLIAGWWRAQDRPAGAVRTGRAVAAAGAGLGLLTLIGALAAARADTSTLRGALLAAGWGTLSSGLWWTAGATVLAGVVLALVSAGREPRPTVALGHAWRWVSRPPERSAAQVVRGMAFVAAGAAVLVSPTVTVQLLTVLAGVFLVLLGVEQIGRLVPRPALRARTAVREPGLGSRRGRAVGAVVAVALLIAVLLVGILPTQRGIPAATAADSSTCNGHVELCARRYNDVAYPAAHNAMSAVDEPGWFLAEQPTGPVGLLERGVRVLLIDTWYGQPTTRAGFTVTAPRSYAAALAASKDDNDPAVVISALRLRAALTPATTGPPVPYLCHGLCETGSTPLEPVLRDVGAWMRIHPREVVTLFIEDSVTPEDTAAVFDQAGLLPLVHTPVPGQPWPTLGSMIGSGHRLVVLSERKGGGALHPWLQQGFDVVQDTPYTNPTPADLVCTLNRGAASDPLLLINNWLSGFTTLVSDARKVNARSVLQPYVDRCRAERERLPNYVAVNFVDQGDLFAVVDHLNGFG
ncbi:MAG: hypothetical protein ABI181_09070 [Mycobacteriaceae bacterium]